MINILYELLDYESIVLQCHDNPDPDTLAAAFGVYRFLCMHHKKVEIIYGGATKIKRRNLKMMISNCKIPIRYVDEITQSDILVTIDCQYGLGNVYPFVADQFAMIDHHVRTVGENSLYLIKSEYQSCSTIVYELLRETGYDVKADLDLCTAFLFGLYIDTSGFQDLYFPADIKMRNELRSENPILERMIKSNLTESELFITGDALYHHYMDIERQFIVVPAWNCDQAILGLIADLAIQVDSCQMCIVFTECGNGYSFSIRGCSDIYSARDLAIALTKDIGNGGGHEKKAGGQIAMEMIENVYGEEGKQKAITDIIIERTCAYMD